MNAHGNWRIGIDVGGTNTDICAVDESAHRLHIHKLPTSVHDQSEAMETGIRELSERIGFPLDRVDRLVHGTTVGTNCVLEQKGAEVLLLTTEGFRDLLEIGRQKRPDLYDLRVDKAPPLVPRNLRFEIPERVDYRGKVIRALDEERVARVLDAMAGEYSPDAIAILFLYSFHNPVHENAVARLARAKFPDAFISVSHEVSGQFREYERLCATVLNAYVGSGMKRYLENLDEKMAGLGIRRVFINQSNGGIMSVSEAMSFPVRTMLSGPAAGAMGAKFVTGKAGYDSIIAIDIGGTSADISLIHEGKLLISKEREIAGYPVRIPALDISTIGAGGGSIAWVDSGGVLKVGPESAGADPGPACYDRGGTEATITDARVVLGHLNPDALLGGRLPIRNDKAVAAIDATAKRLGMDLYETAYGVLRVANSHLVRAIRRVSVERGYNPEDFVLVPFGGAGPLHAAELMRELNIKTALIPHHPGILAAFGLLTEDFRNDFIRTHHVDLDAVEPEELARIFDELEADAERWFDHEHIVSGWRRLERSFDMRYRGQNYEIHVPYSPAKRPIIAELQAAFEREYKRLYHHISPGEPMQIVNVCLTAVGTVHPPDIVAQEPGGADAGAAIAGKRTVRTGASGPSLWLVYERERLSPGHVIRGPAIVEQMDTTTLIDSGQTATVDVFGNMILKTE